MKFGLKKALVFVALAAVIFAAPVIVHHLKVSPIKSHLSRDLGQLEWHEQRAVNWLVDSMLQSQLDVDASQIILNTTTKLLFATESIPSGGPVDFLDGRYFREKEGRGVRKQYYAVIDNQPVLLRLEGVTGNSMPNGVDHFLIGLERTGNPASKLIDRLKSELADGAQKAR